MNKLKISWIFRRAGAILKPTPTNCPTPYLDYTIFEENTHDTQWPTRKPTWIEPEGRHQHPQNKTESTYADLYTNNRSG